MHHPGGRIQVCLFLLVYSVDAVSRIKVSGNAVNFKVANNELRFMLRMPPESAQIFCFTFINIYTARLSD